MNRSVFVILVCVCWASLPFSVGSRWNYEDPESWEGICKTGKEQSPIDITGATQDKALDQFALTNYDMKMNNNFTATNNGHSIQISLPYAKFYNVSKGGLTGTYTTVQFHLHWGKDNSKGSEHTVDGRKYAAESGFQLSVVKTNTKVITSTNHSATSAMDFRHPAAMLVKDYRLHFVSYNTKYSNLDASLSHADGAAVLGVLIEVGDADNEAFSFLEIASNLTNAETYEKIKPFKLDPILPKDKTKYFRYQGSLTTPGCNEAVTWTVFKNSVKISERQMGLLRSLKDEHGKAMADNYRPVQELYERTITASFMVPTCSASEIKITAVLVLSMLLAFLFLR